MPNQRGTSHLAVVLMAMTEAEEDNCRCPIILQASTHVTSVNHLPKQVTWLMPKSGDREMCATYHEAMVKELISNSTTREKIRTIIQSTTEVMV